MTCLMSLSASMLVLGTALSSPELPCDHYSLGTVTEVGKDYESREDIARLSPFQVFHQF